eukprot:COSAG05_NODE_1390_length_5002_cov_2.478075_4_plen_116_part_00
MPAITAGMFLRRAALKAISRIPCVSGTQLSEWTHGKTKQAPLGSRLSIPLFPVSAPKLANLSQNKWKPILFLDQANVSHRKVPTKLRPVTVVYGANLVAMSTDPYQTTSQLYQQQ